LKRFEALRKISITLGHILHACFLCSQGTITRPTILEAPRSAQVQYPHSTHMHSSTSATFRYTIRVATAVAKSYEGRTTANDLPLANISALRALLHLLGTKAHYARHPFLLQLYHYLPYIFLVTTDAFWRHGGPYSQNCRCLYYHARKGCHGEGPQHAHSNARCSHLLPTDW
jgi:hypothetical protein